MPGTAVLESVQVIRDLVATRKAVTGWVDPKGVAHNAPKGHESFVSDEARGYDHYSFGWLRFYVYEGPKSHEMGFQSSRKVNSMQRATIARMIELIGPINVWTSKGALFTIEFPTVDAFADKVVEQCYREEYA